MAHNLRRPLLTSVGLLSGGIEHRCFSHGAQLLAANPKKPRAPQQPRRKPERSVRITAQEQENMTSDLGILPDTFIYPSHENRPSFFAAPREYTELKWEHLRRQAKDVFVLAVYYFQMKSPRPKLGLRSMIPTAIGLQSQMYIAYADKDEHTIRKICTDGLRDSLLARMASRQQDMKMTWEHISFNRKCKVMSHRAATLGSDGAAIRQAVIRLDTRQKLSRYRANGEVIAPSEKAKDILEYVVIQKRTIKGKEQDWQIWGTTEETTLEKVRRQRELDLQ